MDDMGCLDCSVGRKSRAGPRVWELASLMGIIRCHPQDVALLKACGVQVRRPAPTGAGRW